ncbi:MAG: hypothetical protein IH989_01680 [Planctomycetes bacterium]|nr:hypothetical protein [Planctomycetota bacterium]
MSESSTKPGAPRKRARRLRIALLVLACMLPLAGGFAYRYYTRPHRVRAMAEAFLQRHVNGRVRVGEAEWSWLPNLRLYNVTIDEPTDEALQSGDVEAPVFFCPEVRLELGLASMLFGRPALESIQAIEPSCVLVRDANTGRFNVQELLRLGDRGDDWMPSNLPNVELRDARIRLVDRSDEARRLVEDLTITVRARSWKDGSPGYDVTWQVEHGQRSSGHARIDLGTGRVRSVMGGLPWMNVDTVALAVNAKIDAVEAWRDVLGLTGSVRAKHFDLGGDESGKATQSVVVELRDASLSVPIGDEERGMPVDQRYLRFDRVYGEVELKSDGLVAKFSGLLHGSECDVSATIQTGGTGWPSGIGDFENLGLEAEVTITEIMLPVNDPAIAPEQARFIRNLPALAKVYADYDPHGVIDLVLSVSKPAGADQQLILKRLHVNTRGADFSAAKFPYRIHDAHGTIERRPDGEMVCALRGLGTGGTISIDGTFGKVARGHEKRVTLSAKNVPLDDAFWLALPSRFEKVRRQFAPSGRVDLEVVLTPTETTGKVGLPTDPLPGKPVSPVKKWQFRTTASLLDVSGTYDRFPYPLENLTGTIVIDGGSVTVTDLVGRSDQAIVSIDGSLVVDADGLSYLDMTIQGRAVPIDERLLAALPARARREIEAFHPQGGFDSRTSLSFNTRDRRVEQTSVVTLNGVAVRCDLFPLPITNVTGRLHITDRQAAGIPPGAPGLGFTGTETRFENLSGRFRDATFEVNGVSRRGVDGATVEVTLRGRDIRLDEQTRRWLPASVLDQIGLWDIDGPIATETVLTSDPTHPGGFSQRTRVTLAGATVSHPRLPIAATDVRGELVIDQTGLRSTKLTARYDSANVLFAFDAGEARQAGFIGDGCGVTVMSATGLTLNDSVRDLLPPRLSGAWSRINPAGRLSVYLDEVQCRRSPDGTAPQYTIRGRVELKDVSLGHEGFITRSNGTIELEGVIHDADGGTSLSGTLALARMKVFDHRIDQMRGEWSYACTERGDGTLVLGPVRGGIHGGLISGEVRLEFTPDQLEYSVTTTVRNMRLESFLGAAQKAAAQAGRPPAARGTVHGHLHVTGTVDGKSSPRGGGRFEIVDGHLYRLPLILGILHVLKLSLPGEDAFDEARAEFLVVGDRIELKDIRLHGEALALQGTGVLFWPDRAVDLKLVGVSRDDWTGVVPLLADLIEGATRELGTLYVTGKLSNPKIRLEPFRAIREELQTLFKKKKPKQIRPVGS